jgi:hypothetical protein
MDKMGKIKYTSKAKIMIFMVEVINIII